MGKTRKSIVKSFFVWLLIVPVGSIYLYTAHPPPDLDRMAVFLFAALGFLTIYSTMDHRGRPVFLVLWLTIPAFLLYGVFVEMVIMQLAVLAFLLSENSRSIWYVLFFNSTIVFLLSISAAIAFHLAGGQIGAEAFWPTAFAVLAYQLTHTVLKEVLLRPFGFLQKDPRSFSDLERILIIARTFVIIPLALSLFYLIQSVGWGAFFLLGMPFFLIMIVIRLYTDREKSNYYLRQSGMIGRELSDLLDENEIMDRFVEKAADLFKMEYAILFDHQKNWLKVERYFDHSRYIQVDFVPLASGEGIAGRVLKKDKPVIYRSRDEWNYFTINRAPADMESMIGVPIKRNRQTEAVLLLAAKKKRAFNENQLKILDLLCSYFTVSIEKARYMQDAKLVGERCVLTKLYNYRYLEECLDREMQRVNDGSLAALSVIMLDIDHFKKVNDTHGHQGGNDILCALAEMLKARTPEGCTVGRYGGEEFVFIMPGWTQDDAYQFAENLRTEVAGHVFRLQSDLGEEEMQVEAQVTVSIGVSSAPEDADEAIALLRNADRALYIGAKQAGRNRVAAYRK
ncbi:sensor domain-containing diguanylate cyclase [Bacillus sp. OxB-1]|uniref:sensor domain-containing diguanylate cyclase n=1 Tax=Bacillus sp. (strain OxB-1) TaxID=98228 RepID=UPI00130E1C15|nr:sensor domain-containing diguanylate cyclase [Bacillus sp. OxB-1]